MNIDTMLCRLVDCYYSCKPQKRQALARHPKLVAHRGEHDNRTVFENTLAAFDRAMGLGAWGIELDIRWTKDGHPVVIHDQDCRRVFASDLRISQATLVELKERVPLVPTLAEVIERYGTSLHLMIELKTEPYQPDYPAILYDHLQPLKPCADFHILSLNLALFRYISEFPSTVCLPVAEKNVRKFSRAAMTNGYGGLTGHYLLLNNRLVDQHRQLGQCIGTGFISSRNCLFRELNREVEWIFTNCTERLCSYLEQEILQ
jgi:glycerophosphoryl diester phosphodiesterase